MRKISMVLALSLSVLTANSFAFLPNRFPLNVYTPKLCGGFTFGISALYWESSVPHSDYALTYPGINFSGDGALTDGLYHSSRTNYDWGYKANIGYVFPCSATDVSVNWTHYTDDEKTRVNEFLFPTLSSQWPETGVITTPVITAEFAGGDIVTIMPATFVIPPVGALEPQSATAKADFDYDAADLELAQHINIGNFKLRYFGGLRYANLEHKFDVTYQALGTSTGALFSQPNAGSVFNLTLDLATNLTEIVNQKTNFEGVGPRFGVDAQYPIAGGFNLLGSISTSLLVGEIDNSFFENFNELTTATVTSVAASGGLISSTVTVGSVLASVTDSFENFKQNDEARIIPNIDVKLGLGYSYQFCNPARSKIALEAGWMVSQYFNSIDRFSETSVLSPELRAHQVMDTAFDGPYMGIQITI